VRLVGVHGFCFVSDKQWRREVTEVLVTDDVYVTRCPLKTAPSGFLDCRSADWNSGPN